MTYDELIASGVLSGANLALRQRMAEYTVDGMRLGAMEQKTKSGSSNDVMLEKRINEILTAANALARRSYENVELFSLDSNGNALEAPDLDARLPDGTYVGIEVADVVATADARHEASKSNIKTTVDDLLDSDTTFRDAFGDFYFALSLNSVGPYDASKIAGKRELWEIREEVIGFVRSLEHRTHSEEYFRGFPENFPKLHARGAQFHSSAISSGPYFSINEGASIIGHKNQESEVLRVLNKHQKQAAKYRKLPTWLVLFINDPFEYFHNTVSIIEKSRPPISPFLRVYLSDAAARTVELSYALRAKN